MASSGNFCTGNPNYRGSLTSVDGYAVFTLGDLKASFNNNQDAGGMCTHSFASGKFYFEFTVIAGGNESGKVVSMGIADVGSGYTKSARGSGYGTLTGEIGLDGRDGKVRKDNSVTKTYSELSEKIRDGNIVGVAVDADNGAIYFSLNGTFMGSGDPTSGSSKTNAGATWTAGGTVRWVPTVAVAGGSNPVLTMNFGQDSSFCGAKTSGSAASADGEGFGDFYYAPPSGFLALCSANLPIGSGIDPNLTDDDHPQKQFGVVTYTGNSGTNAISGLGFQPDLLWFKIRNTASNGPLVDSSRGVTKTVFSQITDAEVTNGHLASFDSDGFTLNNTSSDYLANFNTNTNTYVAWAWKCNGGTTATNSEGTTTCTTQANTNAGFSIITYTGTGSAATLGHGLDGAPEFVMVKRRSGAAQRWVVYHIGVGETKYLTLQDSDAAADSSGMFNDTAPSATLLSIGNESNVSTNTLTYIAYCWQPIEGFSNFGKFTGNNVVDGAFIYTGFRPRMLFVKSATAGENWAVFDTARNTTNTVDKGVFWDSDAAETVGSGSGFDIDFLSNGFKMRANHDNINGSQTYVFGAWGDVPFRYNNAF